MSSAAITHVWDDTNTVAPPSSRRCPVCGASYPGEFVVCPKDATVLQAGSSEDDPLIGEVLAGSFRVMELLGSGGMGRVYAADHVRLPKRFAVKVLHETMSQHQEAAARFEREAQAVASVSSEHVVEVVDIVRSRDGLPCLISELLDGEDLSELCHRGGKVPLSTAITIGRQVCRGLAAAHAAGIVHRDLKPSNVFLLRRPDDRVHIKILDFGVAKLTDGKDLTRTGSVVGTPAYMAPEQALGSAGVDARADVYGVGAILYKLLTGSAPFPDEDPVKTLRRVVSEDPKRPRELERGIPEAVELLIQRAMARSPADRPASAAELECELAEFDERARADGPKRVVPAAAAKESASPAGPAPLVSSLPPPSVERARRAKGARPAAFGLALAASLAAGTAVFAIAGTIVLLVAERPTLTSMEKMLLGVITGLFVMFACILSMRALVSRWRSAWAVDRLAQGLRVALLTLLSMAGLLAIGWRTYRLLGPLVALPWLPILDIAVIGVPTLVSAMVFVAVIRKAQTHS
jgi:serine/threonine-protein kinase